MTALAQRHQALNLAQGLMWMEPDPALLEWAARQMREPTAHQYTLPEGHLGLRTVVAQLGEHFFGVSYDPVREITITAGATEALFAAVSALTQPGQKVAFLEPAYDSYLPAIQLAGAVPVPISLSIRSEGVQLPWEALEAQIAAEGVSFLLLNFPHNPTGYALQPGDLERLEELVDRHPQLYLIVDEAYELMTWHPDPAQEVAIAPVSVRKSPILRRRSVIVGSLGKMVGATGWRLGYMAAPAELTEALRAVHQYVVFCAAAPLQAVVANYLGESLERATYFHAGLLRRRRLLVEALRKETGLTVLPPTGSYFVLVHAGGRESDEALAERLTREVGVATIPLSPFYANRQDSGWLRLCLARPEEMLEEAVRRLAQAFPPADRSTAHLRESAQ